MTRTTLHATLVLCTVHAAGQQWLELREEDRPVTIAASGIVISTDVLRFGPPPSRNWALAITHLAEEGKRIAKGDLLVEFDASNLDNRQRQVAGNLAVTRGELNALIEQQARMVADEKVSLAAAESQARKANRKAEQPPDTIASVEYRKLVEQKRLANAKLERLRERAALSEQVRDARRRELEVATRRFEIMHEAAVQELESMTIRAPREGLVIIGSSPFGNKLDVGDQVHPGIVVIELANDARLAVQAEVPEHLAARLAKDQRVRVEVDSAGGAELQGRVATVANTVRRKSRQSQAMVRDLTVRFPSDAPTGLRLGMSVQIAIEVALLEGVLAVPETALSYRSGAPGVVLRGGSWAPVVLGERSQDMYVIRSGVQAGQEIRL